MNAVFTIVAKNYLPLAFAQAETVKKYQPDIDYSILLADSEDGIDLAKLPYNVRSLNVLNISDLKQMAFKYNVTEFCTAVKPYYINYLFESGYQKVIYLDPDVCLFSSIQPILDELSRASVVLTPHFVTPEINYSGTITEALLLHVGVYNLGFGGFANTEKGRHLIQWWQSRLYDMSYQDKIEALHTDQKWMDLVPAFYGDQVLISGDIGRNMAFWNLHERKLIANESGYVVQNRFTGEEVPLMLFHFAGYDIRNADTVIHKNHPEYGMTDFPELKNLFKWYKEVLLSNRFEEYIKLKYGYNYFENGSPVTNFQRRLFRRLKEDGVTFEDPFSTGQESFFSFLKKNALLSNEQTPSPKGKDVEAFSGKIKILNKLMRIVKRILGFDKYALLLKFCMRYFRPENQTFLINEFAKDYVFLNENKKVRK